MSTAVIIVISIVAIIINILLSFYAFELAQRKGHDPMSAFIAVMLFSLIGFIAVIFLEQRINSHESSSPKTTKECILFYSEEDKRFRMQTHGELIEDAYELKVLDMSDVLFKLRLDDGKLISLTSDQAYYHMHKHLI